MKNFLLSAIFIAALFFQAKPQAVSGIIYQDTLNVTVIKLWGTHQQRGYALGYLTGLRITDMIVNFVKLQFGSYYSVARTKIIQGVDISIPQEYKDECQAIVDGMNASGTNPNNLDVTDVLIGNSMLDVSNILSMEQMGQGCSTLMSWGDATAGTDLDRKSVVSRHMDWTYSSTMANNNVVIVHFPSEANETKWISIGYSGQVSALSGMNENFSAFQQVMADFTGAGLHSKGYMPIWFAMRRALETNDYNNDGAHNVQDLRQVLKECANGFADGFIVTSIGRDNDVDSTVAMVAELTPAAPTHTFRYNDYDDLIPGDNLYASNFQIARNNLHNYDTRYNSMIANIGDGTLISLDTNWTMMRDHSHQSINMQFMQYAPEYDYLRLSVWRDNKAAYKNDPMVWSLSELFADPCLPVKERDAATQVFLYPNPTPNQLKMTGIPAGIYTYQLIDLSGKLAASGTLEVPNPGMDVSALKSGLYTLLLTGKQKVYSGRFVKN